MRTSNERGIALVTTLLVMMVISALLVGFTAVVMSDQRFRFIDRDRLQAFYGASAGLEKLSADLGNLFFVNVAPTAAQINALTTTAPSLSGVSFLKQDGTSGYTIAQGAPVNTTISAGPYQGLMAMKTLYTIDVTARTLTGGEVHLQRQTETVAIPVFQFGMFSDVDLSFFAGPVFDFGGRIHTNGNLFLAEGQSGTLWLRDKVTAVKEVVRQEVSNGLSIDAGPWTGPVQMATATNAFRNLVRTEGSVVGGATTALNDPTWTNASLSTYNGYIRNGRTGAKALNLALITLGATNTDLVRRPALNENVTNPTLFGERYFSKVSLRVLLSDTAADITNLPTVTATAPVLLDGNWKTTPPNNGTAYGPVDATHPPIATSSGANSSTTQAATLVGDTTINVTNNAGTQWFKPVLTLNAATVTCSGKTANTFTGCTGTPAAANNTTISSGTASTTLNGAVAAGAATITVQVNGTTNFVPQPFWLANTLVTCTGYTATTFTSCAGTPAAANGATFGTNALTNAVTATTGSTIGGYLKIEMQNTASVWQDVTMQILNYGIGAPNLGGEICADPTPNAILRIQRLRDNQLSGANGGGCNYAGSTDSTNYWPNVLFDPREGLQRDASPGTNVVLGGVMHYIKIDAGNLSKWFKGQEPPFNTGSGSQAITDNGYSVYFSDRRNNRNAANQETGEYGFEDFVNPTNANGAPNGALDTGEDVNANNVLDTYGQFPSYNGVVNALPPGAAAPLDGTARPTTQTSAPQAKVNRALLFRRALKLVNGSDITAIPGLTIAAENPVYIQGNWNATGPQFFNGTHAATSVVADGVTLLSNIWNDNLSFSQPYSPGSRPRDAQTYYRLAIIGGKGQSFPHPAGWENDLGLDGGAHNFLRYLEGGGGTLNYRGSIATFYFNRQAVGTYKCCTTVYSPPTRAYAFDTDFLDPAKLPPLTPVFRDLNTIGFSQETRPGK